MFRAFRKLFAIVIAASLFGFLSWFFGIFIQPQGTQGAGFALGLIAASAVASLIVYSWLATPGPLARFRNRGVDGMDKDWGVGMVAEGQRQKQRRRDEDADPEDIGGRRSSGDIDSDMDDGAMA